MKQHVPPDGPIEIRFQPFADKMEKQGLSPTVIDTFRHYYTLLVQGETGLIEKTEIEPVREDEIADSGQLAALAEVGREALEALVVIKFNGGLGTSMGLSQAKSLLEVRADLTFLDVIARQIMAFRDKHRVNVSLVFMNSFSTDADTRKALSPYPGLAKNLPLTFLQHKFPKVFQKGLSPVTWPRNPDMEWNPPGHGDIYTALVTSGMLQDLLDAGIHYAFISNSDNLGAVVDESLLGHFVSNDLPFMMEVADRTEADRKGGHLARLRKGGLTLREIAQCPEEEMAEFQDVSVYKYFNTNTIWVNLLALRKLLEAHQNVVHLPMIRNPKTVDPKDDTTPLVYQLETAAGSAVSVFEGASAVRVPRTRFAPVKKCQDLLALWSDCYVVTDDYRVVQNPERKLSRLVLKLDDRFYKGIDQLKSRFPEGAPALLECESLEVQGDVRFGKGVVIRGNVAVTNGGDSQVTIPDGTVIEEDVVLT